MRTITRTPELYRFHNSNVVYLAYVGRYNNHDTFKYGISSNIYNRVLNQHKKQFQHFELYWVKQTYNMTFAESLFEQELKLKNIHTELVINNKKQTELFFETEEYSYEYIKRLYNRIANHADKDITDEIKALKREIRLLKKYHEK